MIFVSPKNFKSGRLINSKYTIFDLIILFSGILVTFIAEILFITNYSGESKLTMLLVFLVLLIPALIVILAVQPFDIYHNIHTYLRILILYFKRPKKYIWGGLLRNGIFKDIQER